MLTAKEKLSLDDFKRMMLDQHSDYAAILTPHILELKARNDELTSPEKRMLDTLTGGIMIWEPG